MFDHLCQSKCTRINYDNPLLIRSIKRFNAEKFDENLNLIVKNKNGIKVSVIGAGPAGLSCAYFLALEGFDVQVYESRSFAGGMVSDTIPSFRITDQQIKSDIQIIESLGVKFLFIKKEQQNFSVKLKKKVNLFLLELEHKKQNS